MSRFTYACRSSIGLAAVVALVVASAACSDGRRNATILAATLRDERTLDLSITACNAQDNRTTVKEDADAVTIAVSTDDPAGGDSCSDSIVVRLTEPFGDRQLIDATTGEPVEVDRSR